MEGVGAVAAALPAAACCATTTRWPWPPSPTGAFGPARWRWSTCALPRWRRCGRACWTAPGARRCWSGQAHGTSASACGRPIFQDAGVRPSRAARLCRATDIKRRDAERAVAWLVAAAPPRRVAGASPRRAPATRPARPAFRPGRPRRLRPGSALVGRQRPLPALLAGAATPATWSTWRPARARARADALVRVRRGANWPGAATPTQLGAARRSSRRRRRARLTS